MDQKINSKEFYLKILTNNLLIEWKTFCNNRYTAADFQLYLLAPIVFLVFYNSPKIGLFWNIFLVILGIFTALAPKIIFGTPYLFEWSEFAYPFSFLDSLKSNYWGIESHVVSYMLGMLLGYLIRQKPNLYFGGRFGELFIWIISWSLTSFAFYWNKDLYNPYNDLTQTQILLWIAFSKLCYLSGWFFLLYFCTTGRGGLVLFF